MMVQVTSQPDMVNELIRLAALSAISDGRSLLAATTMSRRKRNPDRRYEEYQTSAYSSADFQPPSQKFSGNYSDKGVDTDGEIC